MTFTLLKVDKSKIAVIAGIVAMATIVSASNYLVNIPINEWLTYGAFTFPITFFVADIINHHFGPANARKVAYAGLIIAVVISFWLATPRIALASGTAFIIGQLLDISIFHKLRHTHWWNAPLASSTLASAMDTAIFFAIAFAGTDTTWVTWAIGDYGIKMVVALTMLLPFYALMGRKPLDLTIN